MHFFSLLMYFIVLQEFLKGGAQKKGVWMEWGGNGILRFKSNSDTFNEIATLLNLCFPNFIPWSRLRAALGHTRTWQRRRWWRWRPQNNGSTFSAPTSDHPRRRAWSWGSWKRSGLPRCRLSSPSSSGCPALWAGSPWLLVCLGRPGSWKRDG